MIPESLPAHARTFAFGRRPWPIARHSPSLATRGLRTPTAASAQKTQPRARVSPPRYPAECKATCAEILAVSAAPQLAGGVCRCCTSHAVSSSCEWLHRYGLHRRSGSSETRLPKQTAARHCPTVGARVESESLRSHESEYAVYCRRPPLSETLWLAAVRQQASTTARAPPRRSLAVADCMNRNLSCTACVCPLTVEDPAH